MLRLSELKLPLDHTEEELRAAVVRRLKLRPEELLGLQIIKRAYDARKKGDIQFVYILHLELTNEAAVLRRFRKEPQVSVAPDMSYRVVAQAPEGGLPSRPIVVGTGPCGMFAGLMLARMGFKPIILERGKPVRERTQDTFGFWRKTHDLNPESNAQFGEGGAGTFSDGKLYSQVRDPKHYGRKVIAELVEAGAPPEIVYLNKPHIGTFRLVTLVQHMRATIEALGGEYHFQSRVDELLLGPGRQVRGVRLADGREFLSDHVVMAVGHSARDTFQMLHERGVHLEAKPFSIGFRIEHPQDMINQARLGPQAGHKLLGAADYKLVHHASNGRTVYSFCMCPGGLVVATASEPGRVVTNGMSQYARNEANANSGIVVGIGPEDFPSSDPLAGIELQRRLEAAAFELGGGTYAAPAQLVGDFLTGRPSSEGGEVRPSYRPGVTWTDLAQILPAYVVEAVREALPAFGRQIPGYDRPDAVMTGLETRTSSPIRLLRDEASFESVNTPGLYPGGEGAGYAGGILSAGIDGIKLAEAVALSMLAKAATPAAGS